MRASPIVLVLAGLLVLTPRAGSAQDRCSAARELMASSLSKLQAGAGPDVLRDALDGLRRATQLCPDLADGYYYLSLVADQLKDPRRDGWRRQASVLGSEALKAGAPLTGASAAPPTAAAVPGGAPPASNAVATVPTTKVSPYVRRKLALVVAVAKFKDTRINALRFTTNDGQAFADTLKTDLKFDYVKTLFDEQATTYQIKTEIDQLARMADPEDLVVIYFATHGSPDDLDTAGINYIVSYDTEVSNLYATAYRMDDLADDIGGRIKSERVVAFLDTCYSGGTFRDPPKDWKVSSRSVAAEKGVTASTLQGRITTNARSIIVQSDEPRSSTKLAQGVGRVIITASGQSERSWEDEKIQHGYFTYFVLQALKAPGSASIEDIYSQVRIKVPEAVRSEQHQSQNPTIARNRERVDLHLRDTLAAAPATRRR